MLCVLCLIVLWGFPLLLPIRVERLGTGDIAIKTVHGIYCSLPPYPPSQQLQDARSQQS